MVWCQWWLAPLRNNSSRSLSFSLGYCIGPSEPVGPGTEWRSPPPPDFGWNKGLGLLLVPSGFLDLPAALYGPAGVAVICHLLRSCTLTPCTIASPASYLLAWLELGNVHKGCPNFSVPIVFSWITHPKFFGSSFTSFRNFHHEYVDLFLILWQLMVLTTIIHS